MNEVFQMNQIVICGFAADMLVVYFVWLFGWLVVTTVVEVVGRLYHRLCQMEWLYRFLRLPIFIRSWSNIIKVVSLPYQNWNGDWKALALVLD